MKKIMFLMIAAMFSLVVFAQDKKMTEMKPEQLPKEATKWVTQNVPGGTIVRAGKVEEKNVLTYVTVVELKGQKFGYQFDKDGKFLGKVQAPAAPVKAPATQTPPAPKK